MASSMFQSILATITPEMTQSIAGRLGGSSSAVQTGLSAATAATLHGLSRNSNDPSFIDKLMQMVGQAGSQNMSGNIGSIASGGASGAAGDLVGRFASLVFGPQQEQVASLVSQHSGLSGSAGSGLLKTAGALVLGYLARLRSAESLNASTLASALRTEGTNLANYVPGTFLGSLGGTAGEATGRTTAYASNVIHTRAAPPARRAWWVIPAAALAALVAIAAWLGTRHGNRTVTRTAAIQAPANTAPPPEVQSTPAAPPAGAPENVSLPDGTQLNVPQNGVEAKLVGYLQNPSTNGQEVTWFDFDHLLFNTGQATLQPQSNQQLDNVAAILKAYPSAKIRLGGYTDNTGDPTANEKLSEQRADSVMAALVQRGIDPSRLSARGYGQENPVADNSTEEGRQKNRRISIRVAEK